MDRHEWTDKDTGLRLAACRHPFELDPALLKSLEGKVLTVDGCAGREILRLAEELENELTRGQEELQRIGDASEQGHRELVAQLGATLGIEEPAAVLEPIFAVKPFATSMGGALLWAAFQLRRERDRLAEEVERLKEQNGLLRQGQSGDLLDLGAELERARIRRALRREIGLLYSYLNNVPESDIWAIIDRIVAGEG